MSAILIVIAIVILLVLIALKMGMSKKENTNDEDAGYTRRPTIHVSGVYSVLRKSPREELAALRPSEWDMRRALVDAGEGVSGDVPQSDDGKTALIAHWKAQTEVNLQSIEDGDRNGAVYYYYDFPEACPVCAPFIIKGNYVTREEIYKNPQIIPPLHFGCTGVLTAHHGNENNMKETAITNMTPFFNSDTPPELPEWTYVASLRKY